MTSPVVFLALGAAIANLATWCWLTPGRWWRCRAFPVLLLVGWSAAPVWFDPTFAQARHPGHALAVAAGCFLVMGFPAWVGAKLR